MNSGKLWENVIGQKGFELSVVDWSKEQGCVFRFLLVSLFSGCREGTSLSRTGGSDDLLQRKVRKSSLYLPFLKCLQLEILSMARSYILG